MTSFPPRCRGERCETDVFGGTVDGSEIWLTTQHVGNPVKNEIFAISIGARFLPSTVCVACRCSGCLVDFFWYSSPRYDGRYHLHLMFVFYG